MEVADINFMEQQLKAQFDVQKEVYDAEIRCLKEKCKQLQRELDELDNVQKGKLLKRIDEDRQIILDYDDELRQKNTALDKIEGILTITMTKAGYQIISIANDILNVLGIIKELKNVRNDNNNKNAN